MTHPDGVHLTSTLTPRHAALVTDEDEHARLEASESVIGDDSSAELSGWLSETGRVLAWKMPSGERIILEGEIKIDRRGRVVEGWEPAGTPRIYRVTAGDDDATRDDVRRLFLAHSIRTGAARRFTGWRERIVAMIPEEVGAKETNILRTTADGQIEATHTYNVLDAYATYAQWVNELAFEFGSTDELLMMDNARKPGPDEIEVLGIAQAWLLREAATAQLEQARHSLKFGLAGHARWLQEYPEGDRMSVAELARSLHTDRPNLSKVIKTAEADPDIQAYLDALHSDDRSKILQ
jgi:hypothetical protein